MTDGNRFYGKYRGTVINNVDPKEGRIMCLVPDVLGVTPSGWAVPCFQFGGPQMGQYALPQIGSGVWVEFEAGDPEFPIWSGSWYGGVEEVPALATAVPPGVSNYVVTTQLQNTLSISDLPGAGGIMLRTTTGAFILMNETGITISNGQGAIINMAGPTVTVNAGALVVT